MQMKILCLHGVGGHAPGGDWQQRWTDAIREPWAELAPEVEPQFEFLLLDELFDAHPIGFLDTVKALGKLAASGLAAPFRQPRGLSDRLRWTAGMVVQWVENETLRRQTRQQLANAMRQHRPGLVIGHSLGSLVAYDTFTHTRLRELASGISFVSCGSQIGNPFVVGNFAYGRLVPLKGARHWFHLYNRHDDIFTAPIRLGDAANFRQVDTPFDTTGRGDHDVARDRGHRATAESVWTALAREARGLPSLLQEEAASATARPRTRAVAASAHAESGGAISARPAARKPRRRALLVGINEYAGPAARLTGCVNDVFLVSALLQESGFAAEDIRVVLDDRATAAGLRERLDWLLDDARAGDTCFFHFSGHGTQVPVYGPDGHVDQLQETLVTHDFDWDGGLAFSDQDFQALYSQLPYGLRFVCLFDCCHSAGMTRTPAARVRGVTPPDDIRHRLLRWDTDRQMWTPRRLPPSSGVVSDYDLRFNGPPHDERAGSSQRLGQAMSLRASGLPGRDAFKLAAKARGHQGPYLPTLLYACGEQELAHEYLHGSVTYGAFTYCFVKALRAQRSKRPGFEQLVSQVRDELAGLGYAQRPVLVAPKPLRERPVPRGLCPD